jgi:nucleolar protein 16
MQPQFAALDVGSTPRWASGVSSTSAALVLHQNTRKWERVRQPVFFLTFPKHRESGAEESSRTAIDKLARFSEILDNSRPAAGHRRTEPSPTSPTSAITQNGSRTPEEEEQVGNSQEATKRALEEEDPAESHHSEALVRRSLTHPSVPSNICRNQKETLSQNYRRLGLTARLNHAAGGQEKTIALLGLNDAKSARADTAVSSTANALNIVSKPPPAVDVEELQVERDPDTGAILRVVGGQENKENPLNDPLNELEGDEVEWDGFAMVPEQREGESENPVIRELEEAARNGARKAPRKQSQLEEQWLERLVEAHGEDYTKMARDRKLNPMQQTEADIKKRVRKWRASQAQE